MAKKDRLSGGLQALIGNRDQKPSSRLNAVVDAIQEGAQSEPTAEQPTEEQIEEATPQEEDELLNTIEDEELREALEKKRNDKRGRPRKDAQKRLTQEEEYTRFCTLVKRDQIAKLKEICFRETLTLKEVLGVIFEDAITAYEKKKGEITPQRHHGDATTLFK